MVETTQYDLFYCDEFICRVNTFERGTGVVAEQCPGCGSMGIPVPVKNR